MLYARGATTDDVAMDPVVALVGLYRVVGSLFVLRWPFWGAIAAVICDLFDLLLFNLFIVYAGWSGFGGYQTFDKWVDQVYLATFLIVALRDFAPLQRRIAVALYLFRLVGFFAFETGIAPREALFLFPNLFEFWFIAVAFTMRFRPPSPGRRLAARARSSSCSRASSCRNGPSTSGAYSTGRASSVRSSRSGMP